MHITVKAAMVGMLASGGSVFAVGNAAWAIAYCERLTGPPQFSGNQISGFYAVICDRKVGSNTLYGRLKEDRPTLPDTVHDTESFTFTNTDEDSVITSTCQDGDDLYTEAQINKESPLQSSRREMSCPTMSGAGSLRMRAAMRLAAVVVLATGGSVLAVEGTAWALAGAYLGSAVFVAAGDDYWWQWLGPAFGNSLSYRPRTLWLVGETAWFTGLTVALLILAALVGSRPRVVPRVPAVVAGALMVAGGVLLWLNGADASVDPTAFGGP